MASFIENFKEVDKEGTTVRGVKQDCTVLVQVVVALVDVNGLVGEDLRVFVNLVLKERIFVGKDELV